MTIYLIGAAVTLVANVAGVYAGILGPIGVTGHAIIWIGATLDAVTWPLSVTVDVYRRARGHGARCVVEAVAAVRRKP